MRIHTMVFLLSALLLVGCAPRPHSKVSLTEARRGFQTKVLRPGNAGEPLPQPPPGVFRIVQYPAAVGNLPAYLSEPPTDGQKHPAILWITGGDCNTVDDGIWQDAPPDNDQTARAFREAGIVMLFPSLRGGNTNPGAKEFFFGEVDDVLAAADYLAKQPFVDPNRIYLGGHSTGGTLALLVAEASPRFRAVFSFGPVEDVSTYGEDFFPGKVTDPREIGLRSPGRFLNTIQCPVFVFEGTEQSSNLISLLVMQRTATNNRIHFHPIHGADHFTVLGPTTHQIAQHILSDSGPTTNLAFTARELDAPFTH